MEHDLASKMVRYDMQYQNGTKNYSAGAYQWKKNRMIIGAPIAYYLNQIPEISLAYCICILLQNQSTERSVSRQILRCYLNYILYIIPCWRTLGTLLNMNCNDMQSL